MGTTATNHRNLSEKITSDLYLDCIPSGILIGDETCDQWRGEGS
jgi:hypothetical protein